MKVYIILIRGINVGGKSMVPMATLRACLEGLGFVGVTTYIASGNVILQSDKTAAEIKLQIEQALVDDFDLDEKMAKVLVISSDQMRQVIEGKPKGFGDQPDKYHSDVIFMIDMDVARAMTVFAPRDGVDTIWPGNGVIYSQRLSAERTKSRLNKIMGTAAYKSMTIRTWNTAVKLLAMINDVNDQSN